MTMGEARRKKLMVAEQVNFRTSGSEDEYKGAMALSIIIENVIIAAQVDGVSGDEVTAALGFIVANHASSQSDPRERQREFYLRSSTMLKEMLIDDAKKEEREPPVYSGDDFVEEISLAVTIAQSNGLKEGVYEALIVLVTGYLLGMEGEPEDNFNEFGHRLSVEMKKHIARENLS